MKLASLVGTVAAAATVSVTPIAASANDGDADIAVFAGSTTALTPILLSGDGGSYSFNTASYEALPGLCERVSIVAVPPEVAAGCSFASSGSYTNIVCGTGSVFSASATGTEPAPDSACETFAINITFVAGLGLVSTPDNLPVVATGTGLGNIGGTPV